MAKTGPAWPFFGAFYNHRRSHPYGIPPAPMPAHPFALPLHALFRDHLRRLKPVLHCG